MKIVNVFIFVRSLYFWIFDKKSPRRQFRTCLPSCLVNLVRTTHPNADPIRDYVGFIPKLPGLCTLITLKIYSFLFSSEKEKNEEIMEQYCKMITYVHVM